MGSRLYAIAHTFTTVTQPINMSLCTASYRVLDLTTGPFSPFVRYNDITKPMTSILTYLTP